MPIRRIAAGSKSVGTVHPLFLGRVDDRLDRQVVVQRLAAAAMDVADGGADLGVGVGVDVLLEEVDQPAVALQDRQDPQVGARRRREKSGSTRAAKSGSVRIRQKAWSARTNRFQVPGIMKSAQEGDRRANSPEFGGPPDFQSSDLSSRCKRVAAAKQSRR